MARAKGSLVPMRGSVEDWGPGKYQRNLEQKDAYAQKMWRQAVEGPPDFDKLLGTGVPLPVKEAPQKKATPEVKKKAKKTAAEKKHKSR